ncbi:MAG: hypothetical protein R3D26_24140 [Cyanobacteriota/Melainabacteria group bacterium]
MIEAGGIPKIAEERLKNHIASGNFLLSDPDQSRISPGKRS